MFRKLAFGQYAFKNSIMHGLDPRIKIISVIVLSSAAFAVDSYSRMAVLSLFLLLLIILSRLKLLFLLRTLRPFFFIFFFILLMYALFSINELDKGILAVWRFILLISIASILTFTTTITGMVTAIERLLNPLKIIRINTRNFSLLVALTIRFIPALFLYADRVKDAQNARLGSIKKPRNIKVFVIKLLDRVFSSASAVSDALASRNYNGVRVSYFNPIMLGVKDCLSLVILIIVVLLII